ncbi:MAG: glycosyltransferase family 1 protein [Chitinophagaceae bacterium]|nr:glycosyltransferase family 1 protein [Chitinophagaceae bacterium]
MPKTLIRITTVPMAFKVLLAGQPKFMSENGFNVIMISAGGKEVKDLEKEEGCKHIIVPMTRRITPFRDIVSFFKLRSVIKKYHPDIVHTHTPKAGLLGMLAARSLGVKIRIHTVGGLPLIIETGFKRWLLMLTEKLTYFGATEVWPNSKSMMNFIIEQKLATAQKLAVIDNGSTNGIDLKKFSKQNLNEETKTKIKESLPQVKGLKILCVGRMVKDKGIEELVSVFEKLQHHYPLQLILVGPFEPHLDPLSSETLDTIINNPAITHISWSDSIEYYMALADIFVHPSHREGFPNVILQAGAMHLPVICSNIPGNADIIQNEKTGLMFEVKNEDDLYIKLKFAIENKERTERIAHTLFEEVTQLYNRKRIHEVILNTYNRLLKQHGIK